VVVALHLLLRRLGLGDVLANQLGETFVFALRHAGSRALGEGRRSRPLKDNTSGPVIPRHAAHAHERHPLHRTRAARGWGSRVTSHEERPGQRARRVHRISSMTRSTCSSVPTKNVWDPTSANPLFL